MGLVCPAHVRRPFTAANAMLQQRVLGCMNTRAASLSASGVSPASIGYHDEARGAERRAAELAELEEHP